MPSGVASPACSASVQQFFRGRSASSPSTKARARRRTSTRLNRPAIRSSSSSIPACQAAGLNLTPAVTAGSVAVHTPDDGHAVAAPQPKQDQAIYGWSIRQLWGRWRGLSRRVKAGPTPIVVVLTGWATLKAQAIDPVISLLETADRTS